MKMISDEVLVEQAKLGKGEAFEELVRRYRVLVYFIVVHTVGDSQEAEDVVQDVFMSAFTSIKQFDPGRASFKTWLFSIIKRRSIDSLRSLKRRFPLREEFLNEMSAGSGQGPEEFFAGIELKDALNRALLSLSKEQRLCLILQSMEGLSYEEIAKVAGVPVGTVRSRISAARKKLLKYVSYLLEDGISCDATK
ncbi:MAG: sigma-70 family RNA polymerase sigma factor [Actinobacteria bacterium]|nr:sigma-70 family RNA polymerase sigma factor [Actinomycetota bacterium]